jgi:peptidoglycan/xylan/chitin deacetylase (PgdA/CDA1 family)
MRSAILTWHSLDDSGSVISTQPSVFRRQLESLADSGIPVVPLNKVRSTPRSVALTFDDGFQNLAEHAFPLLDRFGWHATVFVVSQYCGRSNQWPSQPPSGIPALPLLSWDQLKSLPPRIAIGAHTATHPHLTALSAQDCDHELRACRDEIEHRIERPVEYLAYPYGDSSQTVRLAASRYFQLATGTSLRFLSRDSNPFDLPRIDMYYFRSHFSLAGLFEPPARMYLGLRGMVREARARLPV